VLYVPPVQLVGIAAPAKKVESGVVVLTKHVAPPTFKQKYPTDPLLQTAAFVAVAVIVAILQYWLTVADAATSLLSTAEFGSATVMDDPEAGTA